MTNWVELVSVIASPLAALGGYVIAGFNDEKRDTRTLDRERVSRTDLHNLAHSDKSREFRLDVLLALQDALQEFAMAVGKVNIFDQKQLKDGGVLTQYPTDLNDGLFTDSCADNTVSK